MNTSAASVFDLSTPEKLQLVEDLWDDVASTPGDVPVYEWQTKEIERRKQNLLRNPGSALSWLEIQDRVRARHAR
ncbi:addiction module protein [Candidatus Sumerlaeota bacterium]|nr:addiction module protein [Candidatus Sumerlaeota bacterium]